MCHLHEQQPLIRRRWPHAQDVVAMCRLAVVVTNTVRIAACALCHGFIKTLLHMLTVAGWDSCHALGWLPNRAAAQASQSGFQREGPHQMDAAWA